jgi:hypothetical protein
VRALRLLLLLHQLLLLLHQLLLLLPILFLSREMQEEDFGGEGEEEEDEDLEPLIPPRRS